VQEDTPDGPVELMQVDAVSVRLTSVPALAGPASNANSATIEVADANDAFIVSPRSFDIQNATCALNTASKL
jgi:hypothetical protein